MQWLHHPYHHWNFFCNNSTVLLYWTRHVTILMITHTGVQHTLEDSTHLLVSSQTEEWFPHGWAPASSGTTIHSPLLPLPQKPGGYYWYSASTGRPLPPYCAMHTTLCQSPHPKFAYWQLVPHGTGRASLPLALSSSPCPYVLHPVDLYSPSPGHGCQDRTRYALLGPPWTR